MIKLDSLPLSDLEKLIDQHVFPNEKHPPTDADRLTATLARLNWKYFQQQPHPPSWNLFQDRDGVWHARIVRVFPDRTDPVFGASDENLKVAVYRAALKFVLV